MAERPDWQWQEMQQVGTDYADIAEVQVYDERMGTVRDVDNENAKILDVLGLSEGASVLEIGCGTGRFTRAAAEAGLKTAAVDVSPIMLDYVKAKIAEQGRSVVTQNAGFLTMQFEANSFDAVVSGFALHHLPDVWKMAALKNIAEVLKEGGQFILLDVVFAYNEKERPEKGVKEFVDSLPDGMRKEAVRHAAVEFSTFDWIMEGLLERAGLGVLSVTKLASAVVVYHCRKDG